MIGKRLLKMSAIALAVCATLAGIGLGGLVWSISNSVSEFVADAQRAHPHPGDDPTALIETMNSDTHNFSDRNHAVWALGRLRDVRALPALEAEYTGARCDHDHTLCQYELEKAIILCGGTPSPPRQTRH